MLAEAPARRPDRDRDHGRDRDRGPGPGGPRPSDAPAGAPDDTAPAPDRAVPVVRGARIVGPAATGRLVSIAIAARPRGLPARRGRPGPPPPPLSKDALAGNVPLRTFGQLKQLWEARTEGPGPDESGPPEGPQQPADVQANTTPEPTMHAPEPPNPRPRQITPEPETPAQSE